MHNLDDLQLKDQLEHELDVLQFLDIISMSYRELIDLVFESGISEEQRQELARATR